MNLINATRLVAGCTMSADKTGREWLVVVAKGTYGIPDHPDDAPRLLEDQVPLVTTDVFTGEPGFSAPRYEMDFAATKPRCDVVLNGSCHAPGGRAATSVPVGMRVGSISKAFNVVGPRVYEGRPLSCKPGAPQPFTVLPISYDSAYGGIDRTSQDPAQYRWHPFNPAGRGYHPEASTLEVDSQPLPNTEELNKAVTSPDGTYRPMAFGPIGRAWQQRLRWAGTYDKAWLDQQFPFLPEDFDTRYFQCAPEDQQIDYPSGGEEVVLMHLAPGGRTGFRLPADLGLPFLFLSRTGEITEVPGVVDTICIEPDEARFTMAWRASLALRRNVREISEIVVGSHARRVESERAHAERMRGKPLFTSLADLVAWSRAQGRVRALRDSST